MRCSSLRRMYEILRKIKGFVFDFDGTLIDSVDAHIESWIVSIVSVLKVRLKYEDVAPLIGLSGRDIVAKLLGNEGLRRYNEIRRVKDRVFLRMIREGKVTTFPGVIKLLKVIKAQGYAVGIASSTPNRLLLHISDYLGISPYVDVFVGGDEVSRGKPNPDIFAKAVTKLNLTPNYAAVIGDTAYDIIPAKKIGCAAILVNAAKEVNPEPDLKFRFFHELTHEVIRVLIGFNAKK